MIISFKTLILFNQKGLTLFLIVGVMPLDNNEVCLVKVIIILLIIMIIREIKFIIK